MRKIMYLKKITACALICAMSLGLAGCGSKGTSGKDGAIGGNVEVTGNNKTTVNLPMTTDPDILDPSRADDGQKNQIVLEVQETLIRMQDGKITPAGAETWDVSDDGLIWTFNLRDNQYSDGTAIKAQDYVNCMLRTFDPEVGSHNAGTFYCIEGAEAYNTGTASKEEVGIKALDERTLEIRLNEPLPYFLLMANCANLTPIPESKTTGESNLTYGSNAENMVYSGPFVIDSWTRGSQIVLKKNPNYWDAANVRLDTVNFLLAQEENTRQQMLEQGNIDILTGINAEYYQKVKSKIDAGEISLIENANPGSSYIAFNNQDPNGIFTNAKIRKAFSLAIDREVFVDNVLKKDKPGYGLVPYSINNGETKYREEVTDPLLECKEDPKTLFEEGLKEIGKSGEPITVTFLQSNANNDTKVKAEFFQNQWQSILGVTVKIDTAADNATFNNQVSKGLYQICNTGWGADYNDPMTFMQCYLTGDGNNPALFSNSRYDELINACKSEPDMKIRQEKIAEAEKILIAEEAGIAPLTYSFKRNLVDKSLKGYSFNGSGGPEIELKTAYFE
ncbi:peptide ABC transporter substrate-binding protein [Anaerocolumna aminovalerica]|jgi:oligopeptide transport system substrate-binding protein|uniref:Oligopeptide transport system substrate-binding protein n=1 Tax=Anaerocolumna aminovalerica TaxID=1527 RepID=A0A1I5H8V9_9FIRM|nr:peptide ABC transporter substrate-binding protein [Anaerocolumna aminovalerica]MBU5334007.1 peptide ABC transporter substrate-binding protein [Anaerocolumna aminovalerica]MDU6265149.1 peptide ABC transporter substrate-binding protein [Anaerocolumna aminovalerica]SFO44647.1 oligopeptide transport system substrate-binding protein [Anaerocolumna aminovalerica]